MTAPDALVERLAGALAEHEPLGFSCSCGWRNETATYASAHRAHLAEVQAEVVEQEIAAARARALRNPYDEDGYCEFCGNGSWKAHAPNCGWADLQDARAEERERIAQAIEAAFPLPSDAGPEPCSAGHDCHAAARYTTGRMAARIARTAAQTPAAEEPHPTCAHCGHVRGLHGRNHGCISAFPDGRSGGSCGCPGYVTPATSPEEGR